MTRLNLSAPATAAAFDRDDPFTYRRVVSHQRNGIGETHDYSRSRRLPARIEDRFTLVQRKPR
jgi:hypothetical protein